MLSTHKCEFATFDYLGSTLYLQRISPESSKNEKFLGQMRMLNTVKQVKRLTGFLQFFRIFFANLGQKFSLFYKILRKDAFTIANDHHESPHTLKFDVTHAIHSNLQLAKLSIQYVIFCEAIFHGFGFALIIEHYLFDQKDKIKNIYSPVSFSSRFCTTTQLKFFLYYKEMSALYFVKDHFAHWAQENQS